MARYTGPVCRICRRQGMKLFLKGQRCFGPKCAVERRKYPPGEHGQGRTFHGVRRCQQDLAVTFEEFSRDMAGNTFGEGNGAIVKRNVNRGTIQRCFPYFEDLFLVESHASQFEVKRLRWPRRFGRNGLLCSG